MQSKILFLSPTAAGSLEKTKQQSNSLIITKENKDDIIELLVQANIRVYNGTNKYFITRKEISNYITKYL